MGYLGPKKVGGSPVVISVYVDDVDATFAKALELGAKATREPEDQFYGDRLGQFEDPWGTSGAWPPTWRTSARRRWRSAWPQWAVSRTSHREADPHASRVTAPTTEP